MANMGELTKTINGASIKYEIRLVDVTTLLYYEKNPRIMSDLEKINEEITQDLVDKVMWKRDETHTLYTTLKKDGGLNEALLVYRGKVIEGNTRLCCLKKLCLEDPERWKMVPCEVIIDEITPLQINRLLIDKHVIGKKNWSAYDKALLYYHLRHDENLSIDEIKALTHESTTTIRNRIESVKLYKKSGCTEIGKYSHFDQVVSNQEIQKMIKEEPEIGEIIIGQIMEGTIPKAQDIRRIPDICRSKDAKKRFVKGGEDINEIVLDLDHEKKFQNSSVIKTANDLRRKIIGMNSEDLDCLSQNNQDKEDLRRLIQELVKLAQVANIRLPNKIK